MAGRCCDEVQETARPSESGGAAVRWPELTTALGCCGFKALQMLDRARARRQNFMADLIGAGLAATGWRRQRGKVYGIEKWHGTGRRGRSGAWIGCRICFTIRGGGW
ncbi:hypothetical protein M0R45_031782 [Rubus argutus]|uniref:Uncharacterized protein n=1 Tax=Rubus argutus TaxID=59490 RepID=A0AAW1WHG8_RUBAR